MEYLIGTILAGAIWFAFYYARKDLRPALVWSSWYFTSIMTAGFVAMRLTLDVPVHQSINPGYWNPGTLLNLNNITGGYAIEDAFFMFFIGGIAAVAYEEVWRKRISNRYAKHHPHIAVRIGVLAAALMALTGLNLIYAVITFGIAGALTIWYQRNDLIVHSLLGGAAFTGIYAAAYGLLIWMFPEFISNHYNFENISGVMLRGLPLEEYLFAFSLGLIWSPLYEYMRDRR